MLARRFPAAFLRVVLTFRVRSSLVQTRSRAIAVYKPRIVRSVFAQRFRL